MDNIIIKIQDCFQLSKVLYSRYAKEEMSNEEFTEIFENEVLESVMNGKIIKNYRDDKPYPSYLIYGRTKSGRPIHTVVASAEDADTAIVITVYEPDPDLWINFERKKT